VAGAGDDHALHVVRGQPHCVRCASPLDEPVVHAVQALAGARGVTMAQVALAWVLRHPAVSAPIVGATRPHHLPEAAAALELKLTDDEAAALEKPYTNHGPSWY
jgi:1-deoxyxylulose-5-phosphate synthase